VARELKAILDIKITLETISPKDMKTFIIMVTNFNIKTSGPQL
jgi:hypothetical protein